MAELMHDREHIMQLLNALYGDMTTWRGEMEGHADVVMTVLDILTEREEQYRGLWKEHGYTDSLFHIRHKAARLRAQFWDVPSESTQSVDYQDGTDLDNAYDLIAYTMFFIQNYREGNRNGSE